MKKCPKQNEELHADFTNFINPENTPLIPETLVVYSPPLCLFPNCKEHVYQVRLKFLHAIKFVCGYTQIIFITLKIFHTTLVIKLILKKRENNGNS